MRSNRSIFPPITACPARSIEKAKDSSAKIASYSNVGVNVTRDLYRNHLISLAAKDKIADTFITLATAGQAFDAAVRNIEAQYGTNAPPKAEIEKLFSVFDREVVSRLIDVLKTIGLSGIPDRYKSVIESIRVAVIVVAKVFGRASYVNTRLAEVS